jgi:hypothetical protein
MINSSTTEGNVAGARSVGSTLDRKFDLRRNLSNGLDVLTILVPVDSSGNIELYAGHATAVDFSVLGYWRGASYTETDNVLFASTTGTWVNLDLGSEFANSVVELTITNLFRNDERAGARSVGSIADRAFDVAADFVSKDNFSLHVNTSGSNGTIQVYSSNLTTVRFNAIGKWDTPPGTYTELMALATSATVGAVWQTKDIGISQGSIAEIIIEHRDKDNEWTLGIRERDSQFIKNWALSQTNSAADGDTSAMLRASVNMTDAQNVEIYHQFAGASHVFTKVGSWASINRIPITTSGNATLFMSGIPAEISTSGDLGGLYPSGVSMFIHGVHKAPVDLFTNGHESTSGNVNLYSLGANVFRTDAEFSAQYPSGVSLITSGSGIFPISGQITATIRGIGFTTSSGDMFTEGFDFKSGSSNLYLRTMTQAQD